MRCRRFWKAGTAVSFAVSLGSLLGGEVVKGGEFPASGSLLSGLVSESDLESRRVIEHHWTDESQPTVSVKSLARQSVPDRNRSSHYRVNEVFTHSKIAMPLLVVDLEPQSLLFVRPMSGRSVGATPSARWTKAVSIVEVAPETGR
ncbi:MAG: hypothetical protein RLZZ440_1120 [Planctomycetota bacterium]|jgi:hypothetical protein